MTTLTDPALIEAELQRRLAAPREPIAGWASHVIPACRAGDSTFSVQASSTHYCLPRGDTGPWTRVEVMLDGYPGRRVSKLLRAGAGVRGRHRWKEPLGWVRLDAVAQAIAAAGGLVANSETGA
jgi:hypothetical protein